MKKNIFASMLMLLLSSALACNLASSAVEALSPTNTPKPTKTDIFLPTLAPLTNSQKTATAEARAAKEMASILEMVAPDFELIGYSPEIGELAFEASRDYPLVIDAVNAYTYDEIRYTDNNFANFILSFDVEWDSETGLAGCGVIFRSGPDVEADPMLRFDMLRLSGLPAWRLMHIKYNQIQGFIGGQSNTSSSIKLGAGTTNHVVMVADGTAISVYVNGDRLIKGDAPERLKDGMIALIAWQDSGETSCDFDNLWVWELP